MVVRQTTFRKCTPSFPKRKWKKQKERERGKDKHKKSKEKKRRRIIWEISPSLLEPETSEFNGTNSGPIVNPVLLLLVIVIDSLRDNKLEHLVSLKTSAETDQMRLVRLFLAMLC